MDEAARRLRREQTEAEKRLWKALRRRKLDGLRFRRQHPVGRFVLDFWCPSLRIAVEVDGEVHERQRARDAARDAQLAAAGIYVLRFRNEEVLDDLDSVLSRIAAEAALACDGGTPPPELGEGTGEGAAERDEAGTPPDA